MTELTMTYAIFGQSLVNQQAVASEPASCELLLQRPPKSTGVWPAHRLDCFQIPEHRRNKTFTGLALWMRRDRRCDRSQRIIQTLPSDKAVRNALCVKGFEPSALCKGSDAKCKVPCAKSFVQRAVSKLLCANGFM